MAGVLKTKPRCFRVSYQNLQTWSVAAQYAVEWRWPDEVIKPLGSILKRRSEAALNTLPPESFVNLLTIRFDGSIEPREPVQIQNVKGKLFCVYPGDVIFSKIDVRNGAIGLAPNDVDSMCATSEFPIYSVETENAHSEYIKLLFRSAVFMKLLNSMISGASGRKRIQPSQLEGVKVPIPPFSIQNKIAEHWKKAQKEIESGLKAQNNLIDELNDYMIQQTRKYKLLRRSKLFSASFSQTPQWDVKAGRAAVFKEANPSFVRLGDYTEECAEMVKPWEYPDKLWPIFGVNNKDGVFLSTKQETARFNAAYKRIEKDWFFHNPTRANVGSLGIVPEVPDDAITSPEYQVWKLTGGFEPEFMDLLLQTQYFLTLVSFNRVGGVKQRMYYSNLAEIRLPMVSSDTQKEYIKRKATIKENLKKGTSRVIEVKKQVEKLILGTLSVEDL
jgi:restriction endonuclease S subunit